jgi:LysR family transcriptional regulator, glycine cleavage system transcriptional activator
VFDFENLRFDIMLRRAPPLASVEAFLAAARSPTFKAAAEALALSQSAFSRRIQLLERLVGAPLFDRSGPALALTEKGARYRDAIGPALEAIREATAQLKDGALSAPLRVSASQSFAIDWLMPRLAALREQHDLPIKLVISAGTGSLRNGEADLAIVGGIGDVVDFRSDHLISLDGVVVAPRKLVYWRPPPTAIADLSDHELLDMRHPSHTWRRWFNALGYPCFDYRSREPFDSLHLMYEAAASGLGLALAVPLATERYLKDARLTPCAVARGPIGASYKLAYRSPEVVRRSAVTQFRTWLLDEVATSQRVFDELTKRDGKHKLPAAF